MSGSSQRTRGVAVDEMAAIVIKAQADAPAREAKTAVADLIRRQHQR